MAIKISTSQAIFRWRPACWLQVTGEDAERFLQGQFTNDLRPLAPGGAVYGLWLTLKGKVQADSFVLRGTAPNEFWIGSYFSPAAVIRDRLESHVIADDVVVSDVTSQWEGVSVLGPDVPRLLQENRDDAGFVFAGRRERSGNAEIVHREDASETSWWAEAGTPSLSAEEIMRRRIAAGIPVVPIDLGPQDLPNEAGLESEAISFTKGCYLGQEVMARLKSMGQVRRRLWRVRGAGEAPPAIPAPVFAGARQVGELRSAVRDGSGGWLGLAMVSLSQVSPHAELSFAANGSTGLQLTAVP